MDIKEIMEIIPHRYPFLLIDKVEELENNKIVAIKNFVYYNQDIKRSNRPQVVSLPVIV